MAATVEIGTLITRTPGIHGGRPHLAGTGVTVARIAGWYKLGRTPEEIVDTYGHISLAQVYAALAYYHANREEIDTFLDAEATAYESASEHQRSSRRLDK